MTSFRWPRVRRSRVAKALCLMNVKLFISGSCESRGISKLRALAHQVFCPANAEQDMTCLPANDATGQSFCPAKTEGCMTWLHLENLERFRVPRTIVKLVRFRVLRTWGNHARFRVPRSFGAPRTLPSTSNLWNILPERAKKSRTHSEPFRQLQLHNSHLSTTQLVSSQAFLGLSILRHTQESRASDATASRRNYNKLIDQPISQLVLSK